MPAFRGAPRVRPEEAKSSRAVAKEGKPRVMKAGRKKGCGGCGKKDVADIAAASAKIVTEN